MLLEIKGNSGREGSDGADPRPVDDNKVDVIYQLIPLQIIQSELGVLGVAEASKHFGFDVKRIYFIQGVPEGGSRGAHAHKALRQCLIALRGSVSIDLRRNGRSARVRLDGFSSALVLSPGCWRDLLEFSEDALLLCLASEEYDESDYIRDYSEFLAWEKLGVTHRGQVPYLDLKRYAEDRQLNLASVVAEAVEEGVYIGGGALAAFEQAFAAYCGAAHAIGLGNGLEALSTTLRAWGVGPGDEVISPAHTFVATALAVSAVGATPVLVDVDDDAGLLDPHQLAAAVTDRTKAILPVHLYGHPVDMDAIRQAAPGVPVLEDACQAHGALYKGQPCGSLGEAAAFSFYPTKNLGALGDGGAVTTRDAGLAQLVRKLANYGSSAKYKHDLAGINSRLDPLQAKVLLRKLAYLDGWNQRRRDLAARYRDGLGDLAGLVLPVEKPWASSSWHVFPVRLADRPREALIDHLTRDGIGHNVHYPIPVHAQPCYAGRWRKGQFPSAERWADQVISLPLDAKHSDAEIDRVIESVRGFFGGH